MDLLIGYTGFVGLNLIKHMKSNTLFINSKNTEEMLGREFDTVYCCGVYAEKWKANKYPEQDNTHINVIIENLSRIKCNRFILISTVDVLDCSVNQSENLDKDTYYASLKYSNHTYGINRRKLEGWCMDNFPSCYICRLPALFGYGLKKNALWDMMNNNIKNLRSHWKFQWYNVDWLYNDIECMLKDDKYRLVHFVTDPIRLDSIQRLFFPGIKLSSDDDICVNYNIGSIYYKRHSVEDIFICMKQFIYQMNINQNLLVSELGWNLEDDKLMIPWLKSRGITNVEAVPSKDSWNMSKYTKIYSAQSILYGEQIQIFKESSRFISILESKLQLLESKSTSLIVFGSPTQRLHDDEEIILFFRKIGELCKKYNIIFCLENNSSKYGCNWMTRINDTINFVKEVNHSHVRVNLDTGSMIMENEDYDINHANIEYIGHVQVSFPNLSIWESSHTNTISKVINQLCTYGYSGKISLEMKSSNTLPFNSIDSFLEICVSQMVLFNKNKT